MLPILVYVTVLLVATCGLVYELVIGTLSSYLLGNSITHFSIVIGVFLSGLGLGAYLSKFVQRNLAERFVEVEYALALIGGLSTPILFASYVRPLAFVAAMYALVLLEGTLVGLEIPLLVRLLRRRVLLHDLLARALAFDYLGSLFASLLFSFVALPHLGLIRTSIAFGLINALIGLFALRLFASHLPSPARLRWMGISVLVFLLGSLAYAEKLTRMAETWLFTDPIVFAQQTRFQRIVVTSGRGAFHLYLDGNLQFSSADEYRYHEALVHPVMSSVPSAARILVLGGGDGLAVRELLRYPSVREVSLVDIDRDMTTLARDNPVFASLNKGSLADPRVRVINDDAMAWLGESHDPFDVVIIDFPDPNNYALGKLYTTRFYRVLSERVATHGAIVVQATSPLVARNSYWCVVNTIESAGFKTLPYHAFVPSFGEWGYVIAARRDLPIPTSVPEGLRYLDNALLPTLFTFSPDMARVPTLVNRMNNQVLVRYYDEEWRKLL